MSSKSFSMSIPQFLVRADAYARQKNLSVPRFHARAAKAADYYDRKRDYGRWDGVVGKRDGRIDEDESRMMPKDLKAAYGNHLSEWDPVYKWMWHDIAPARHFIAKTVSKIWNAIF